LKKILIFVENDFEDSELIYPFYRLQEAGFTVHIVGPYANRTYKGKHGLSIESNLAPEQVSIDNYSTIIIPGGYAPDRMRRNKKLVDLVKQANEKGKIIAAICHGPQLLIEANILKGKNVTCFVSVSTDVINAGAIYSDKSVVVDNNLITSRSPDDLPDFCREVIKLLNKMTN
jgi:protease I